MFVYLFTTGAMVGGGSVCVGCCFLFLKRLHHQLNVYEFFRLHKNSNFSLNLSWTLNAKVQFWIEVWIILAIILPTLVAQTGGRRVLNASQTRPEAVPNLSWTCPELVLNPSFGCTSFLCSLLRFDAFRFALTWNSHSAWRKSCLSCHLLVILNHNAYKLLFSFSTRIAFWVSYAIDTLICAK